MSKYFSIAQSTNYHKTMAYTKKILASNELTSQSAIANVFQHVTFCGERPVTVEMNDQFDTKRDLIQLFFKQDFFGLSFLRLIQRNMKVEMHEELPSGLTGGKEERHVRSTDRR